MKLTTRKLQKVMQRSLGAWLNLWLHKRGLSQKDLAALVKVSEGSISMVLKGQRKVPKKAVLKWSILMGLNGVEADEFKELAYLSHCPEWVVREWILMRAKLRGYT
jgi:transcriptional regulator with XRE-family HTH domain